MKKYLEYVFLAAAIIWMCVIFWFSAQPAVESTQMSMTFGKKICSIFVPGYSKLSSEKQYEMAKSIEFPVRKSAHASEYALLGILWCGYFKYRLKKEKLIKLRFIFPWLIATLYAATDEFHQLFVPGRSCQLRDVMIDSAGAAAGIFIVYVILARLLTSTTNN